MVISVGQVLSSFFSTVSKTLVILDYSINSFSYLTKHGKIAFKSVILLFCISNSHKLLLLFSLHVCVQHLIFILRLNDVKQLPIWS